MKLYLNNLLSRLKQYSENLDRKEIFIEIPWVIVDDNQNQQKYIFKRNGDLIKWEYLSAARSLLIDQQFFKFL